MPAVQPARVTGLREFNRALKTADKETRKFVREAEQEIARPVQLEAQRLAVNEISGLRRTNVVGTAKWALMRIGVTVKVIYVAPEQRGRKGRRNPALKRPPFGTLLMQKAMEPALESQRHKLEASIEQALDRMADHFNHRGV